MKTKGESWVYVWDPFVRLFHWGLVTAFAVAYVTGDEVLGVHVWAGYTIGALVIARLVWGFVGARHARFTDFIYGPNSTLQYLRDLVTFRAARYLGHSPAGGAMVVLILFSLSVTVASGLIVYGVDKHAGPLATFFASPAVDTPTSTAGSARRSDRSGGRQRTFGKAAKGVHEVFANLTLALVALHIAAVAFASFVHRENLVRVMVTGYKRDEPDSKDNDASVPARQRR
jgi:cytochrome b